MRPLIAIVVACGCGSADKAQLDRVEPALVTNLVDVEASVHGERLFATAVVDLDDRPATVDRTWSVKVGDRDVATTWIDPEQLAIVVPAGFTPGVYDVVATSPAGEQAILPAGLTIAAEPVGLALAIEDAPGGGNPVSGTFEAGSSVSLFAAVRDRANRFIANVDVAWTLSAPIGTLATVAAPSTTLVATRAGSARVIATRAGAALIAETGDLVVIASTATTASIEDAPGGTGAVIGDRSGLTTDASAGLAAFAIARDTHGNFVANLDATWSLTGITGVLPAAPTSQVSVDFTTPGTGILHATTNLGDAQTGSLDVGAGRAAQLVIVPATTTVSADAAPFTFTATGLDGDGNPTQDLGALTWTIASGSISSLAATGTFDPQLVGSGTIRVTSSHGATAISDAITVTPGAAATLAITPPSLTIDADAAPVAFAAAATDSDGNATANLGTLTWSISSGPITTMSAAGVFDPGAAGSGTIRVASSLGISNTAPVTVTPGRAASLAVSPPTADVVQGASPITFSVAATDADGNATSNLGTISWAIASGPIAQLDATGTLVPTTPGIGTVRATSSHGATGVSGAIRVRRAATLVASLAAPASLLVTEASVATLTVTNIGESAAANVTPCTATTIGSGGIALGAPAPTSFEIPAGGSATIDWPITATAAGTVRIAACASGIDATTNATVLSNTSTRDVTIKQPVVLVSTIGIPDMLGANQQFAVTLQVTNTGPATATAVAPSALVIGGTGAAALVSAPSGGVSIAGGASASFTFTYATTALGTLHLSGNATGTDSVTVQPVASPVTQSNTASIVETLLVAGDPFGDGTEFAYVAGYRGRVYLGPSRTGDRAVRVLPDGSGLESLDFSFAADTIGNRSTNASTPPYRSIGFTGCARDTSACGPDDENGRGLFAAGTIAGTEWLVIGGSRSGDLDYVYMTTDTDATLDFRFVDVSTLLGGNTRSFSALHAHADRLYMGFPDDGGTRPYLMALHTMPPEPGLDATNADALDIKADDFPGWQQTPVEIVDAVGDLNSLLYVANRGGLMASVVTRPDDSGSSGDWAVATPNAAAFTAKNSRSTTKLADLLPTDRAFPQFASFGGQLYVGRNTTTGPQLWGCDPALGADALRCEPGDWRLVAANSTGDPLLTQFDNASLTSITLVTATPTHLYVGFDSANGAQVFRTANPSATSRDDFTGQLGCPAAQHPATCAGIGGAGVGTPADTRILDGKALTFGSSSAVWLTVGDGTTALALVVIP